MNKGYGRVNHIPSCCLVTIGPGAGKTTLADIVLGLLIPQKGMVKIDGVD